MRSALSPAFTSGKMRSMQKLMDECIQDLLEHFRGLDGKPIDIKPLIGGMTLDVIASAAFGTKVS